MRVQGGRLLSDGSMGLGKLWEENSPPIGLEDEAGGTVADVMLRGQNASSM